MCAAVATASDQNPFDSPECWSIARALPTKVRIIRSASPFCCGVLGADVFHEIPNSSKNFENSADINSPPRSDWKVFIFQPVRF